MFKKLITGILVLSGMMTMLSGCQIEPPTPEETAPPYQAQWIEIPRAMDYPLLHRYLDIGRVQPSAENPSWADTFILAQHEDEQTNDKALVFSTTIDCDSSLIRFNELFIYSEFDAQGQVMEIFPLSGQFTDLGTVFNQSIQDLVCHNNAAQTLM